MVWLWVKKLHCFKLFSHTLLVIEIYMAIFCQSVAQLFKMKEVESLQQRVRDASARGDRYMLMSFEEFPINVKVRES